MDDAQRRLVALGEGIKASVGGAEGGTEGHEGSTPDTPASASAAFEAAAVAMLTDMWSEVRKQARRLIGQLRDDGGVSVAMLEGLHSRLVREIDGDGMAGGGGKGLVWQQLHGCVLGLGLSSGSGSASGGSGSDASTRRASVRLLAHPNMMVREAARATLTSRGLVHVPLLAVLHTSTRRLIEADLAQRGGGGEAGAVAIEAMVGCVGGREMSLLLAAAPPAPPGERDEGVGEDTRTLCRKWRETVTLGLQHASSTVRQACGRLLGDMAMYTGTTTGGGGGSLEFVPLQAAVYELGLYQHQRQYQQEEETVGVFSTAVAAAAATQPSPPHLITSPTGWRRLEALLLIGERIAREMLVVVGADGEVRLGAMLVLGPYHDPASSSSSSSSATSSSSSSSLQRHPSLLELTSFFCSLRLLVAVGLEQETFEVRRGPNTLTHTHARVYTLSPSSLLTHSTLTHTLTHAPPALVLALAHARPEPALTLARSCRAESTVASPLSAGSACAVGGSGGPWCWCWCWWL